MITVTCILTHVDGHSEQRHDRGAAGCVRSEEPLQQIKSTLTYWELRDVPGDHGRGGTLCEQGR
jgi:hypothetical protein